MIHFDMRACYIIADFTLEVTKTNKTIKANKRIAATQYQPEKHLLQ
jgi:hypothetical protein